MSKDLVATSGIVCALQGIAGELMKLSSIANQNKMEAKAGSLVELASQTRNLALSIIKEMQNETSNQASK